MIRTSGRRGRQRGQSSTEYVIVTMFAVLVLVQGGDSSPVNQLAAAMKDAYRGFAYAISYATNLNAL
jgi:hypothetical protein